MRGECIEKHSDPAPSRLDGSLGRFSQQGFELGEDLLNGIEIGTVGRQEEEFGAGGADGFANGLALMAAKIIEDDNVAWFERRNQELFNVGEEASAVDRAVDDRGRIDPVMAKRGKEGQRLPMAVRDFGA